MLDNGRLCERGTRQELLERNGVYAKLYETQAEYYGPENYVDET